VLFLNGSPSAGKTTLAKTLQDAASRPLFHRSLDDFLAGYALRFRQADDGTLFMRVLHGYLRSLRQLADAGNDLVAEAVFIPPNVPLYLEIFRGSDVLLVGVRCPLEIAQERENARTDRTPLALNVPEFDAVHAVPYDLELDASIPDETERSVERLLVLFDDPPAARAFERLSEQVAGR
jgi:chloramphenicol 3-O phosphotransferase